MLIRTSRYDLTQLILISLLCIYPIFSQAAELVIIGHKTIAVEKITLNQAKRLWLGKLKKLGNTKVTVIDQSSENTAYKIFYSKVINKSPLQLRAYWAKKIFVGKAFPPKKLTDDSAIVKWVADTPGGLGYVDSTIVNNTVKILLTAQ